MTALPAATIEGGDVHVIGHRAVLIGMGERTSPMAVGGRGPFPVPSDQADRVVAIELPHSHAFMHLDTSCRWSTRDTFVLYPYFDRHLRSWTLTPGEAPGRLSVKPNHNLWAALAEGSRGSPRSRSSRPTRTSGAAEREQWDDGTNYLAAVARVVIGSRRMCATNTMLASIGSK